MRARGGLERDFQPSWPTRAVCGFTPLGSSSEQADPRIAGWLTLAPLGRNPAPERAPARTRLHKASIPAAPRLWTALLFIYTRPTDGTKGQSEDVERNLPRMRKQKLHNNRLRSTTPIFLPFLGPAAALSSAQYSHRCGRLLRPKRGFPTRFCCDSATKCGQWSSIPSRLAGC